MVVRGRPVQFVAIEISINRTAYLTAMENSWTCRVVASEVGPALALSFFSLFPVRSHLSFLTFLIYCF